jgi:tripartite-type tricarboxylate transporter receptor subunit TctC
MGKRATTLALLAISLAFGTRAVGPAHAEGVADFYRGKQITVIVGSDVGGGYDTYARTLAAHIGRFIPGNPAVLVQNMPGVGSLVATNYIANVAPKDGTVIGAINPGVVVEPLFHPDRAKFDARKFNWLGSMLSETQTIAVWHTAPVQKFEDLFTTELVVPGSGGATTIFPLLLNGVLGTKFKVVHGYKSSSQGLLAIERGEAQGMGGNTLASYKAAHADLLRDGKIRIIASYGLHPNPELANVPKVIDYAKTKAQRAALVLVLSRQDIGRPYILAAGVPADRVKAMRAAFDAMMKSREFLDEAAKRKLELAPIRGEDLVPLINEAYATPPDVIRQVKGLLGDRS